MNSELAWVPISSGTQVQPQITLNLDYLPDYLSVSYDYDAKRASFKDFHRSSYFLGLFGLL